MAYPEVVSVFEDEQALEEDDPAGDPERYMLIGLSNQGRVLQVIYEDDYTEEGSRIFRIITAFEAEERWANEYRQRRI